MSREISFISQSFTISLLLQVITAVSEICNRNDACRFCPTICMAGIFGHRLSKRWKSGRLAVATFRQAILRRRACAPSVQNQSARLFSRLPVLLPAESRVVNFKKTQRLYREGVYPCTSARVASGRRACERRSWSRRGRTPAGRSTSCTTSFRTVSASASST